MTTRLFTAILHREDDLYVAECLEVGTVSQGNTVEEAVANLKEATEAYLEEFPLSETGQSGTGRVHGEPVAIGAEHQITRP